MQMCFYEGKAVYAFEILGKNNIIDFDIEKKIRSASNKSLLKCSECGNRVIFRFKNLDKKRPHFAHFYTDNTQNCSYGKETEEHIEGKKIILERMRALYPGIYHQIRYKIKSINRYADLYFRLDNQELVIEFQRTDLDLDSFEDKIKSYDSININNLWILSGNEEHFKNIGREYNLTFFQRMNINESNKPILFLNVESRKITMLSKITVQGETRKQILMDKLISKTYSVDDLVIKMDGTIDSDFEEFYEAERLAFYKRI